MSEVQPNPATAALLDELRRLAAQLSPDDTPAVVFHRRTGQSVVRDEQSDD